MVDVLIKAFSFILVIIIGYQLKQRGVLQPESGTALSKLMMNFTLPAAVITGFASFQVDHSLLILVAFGLGCNLLLLGIGYMIGRRRPEGLKAYYMINSPGYNIGCFTLPYVQSFLGPVGIVATCLFDAGNSVICTGGRFAAASAATGRSSGWLNIIKRLFSSVPFDVYVFLMIAALMVMWIFSFWYDTSAISTARRKISARCSAFSNVQSSSNTTNSSPPQRQA